MANLHLGGVRNTALEENLYETVNDYRSDIFAACLVSAFNKIYFPVENHG